MARARVLLADDHLMLVEALKKVLEVEYDVVGSVADGLALLKAAQELRPDIVVLDIAMPLLNGLDAGRQLKIEMPGVRLVFLTMNEDPYLVGEAFRAGASAYLLKQGAAMELTKAIADVLKGRTYVTPCIEGGLANISLLSPEAREHAPQPTARQRQVIQLLAEGRSMKEIAGLLNITMRTVASHKYRVMELLQIKTSAELVRYAVKHRIV
ncbi:MAG: response regulator transcription factor [Candidatus Acidiferrum sp.]